MDVDQKAMNVAVVKQCHVCHPYGLMVGDGWNPQKMLCLLGVVGPIRITIFRTSATKLNWGNRSSKMNQNMSGK